MNLKRIIPFFIVLTCALGLVTCTKTKEKKETLEEKAYEIEKHYESTSADSTGETEQPDQPAPVEKEVYAIKGIRNSTEVDKAIEELRKCVTIHRDLVKKYSATGKSTFKEQAITMEEKARKIQENIRKADVQLHSRQVKEAGDLFGELEASSADLSV